MATTQSNLPKFSAFMVSWFGASWRSSLAGYAIAAYLVIEPMIENKGFDFHRDWKTLLGALVSGVIGRIIKDAKTTGLPNAENKVITPDENKDEGIHGI